MIKKVLTDFPRVMSLMKRADAVGLDGEAIIERIASFPNVEAFQVWKNNQSDSMKDVIGRVGRGYYRFLKDVIEA